MLTESNVGYNRIFARIDMDHLRYNIQKMQSLVKPDMKTMVIIKADAYGHGACAIAKRITDLADYFGVATIDEGVELRKAGVTIPILNIGHTAQADFEAAIANDITMAVYDAEQCRILSELAVSKGTKAKVHIKVDTGMARIGFPVTDEGVRMAASLAALPGLTIEGIFTHYAKADEFDKQAAFLQKDRFTDFIEQLAACGVHPPIRHIDNSAGTMELRDNEFDMVRLGIVTYGLYPSDEVDHGIEIRPVMSLIAHIAHIKTLPAGVGVGYGWTYTTARETKVATVTVGYADGYPRAQSNLGRVIIHGQYAPIIGRVCMDQMMVDITDLAGDIRLEDEVILIGEEGGCRITVEEIAAPAASFNYELVCNISRRVPRVYRENGVDVCTVNYLL